MKRNKLTENRLAAKGIPKGFEIRQPRVAGAYAHGTPGLWDVDPRTLKEFHKIRICRIPTGFEIFVDPDPGRRASRFALG